jgi:hypothetical protein
LLNNIIKGNSRIPMITAQIPRLTQSPKPEHRSTQAVLWPHFPGRMWGPGLKLKNIGVHGDDIAGQWAGNRKLKGRKE